MKLYHGSTVDITNIDLSKSKPNKDFGKGFYLSDNRQQAYEQTSGFAYMDLCILSPFLLMETSLFACR